MMWEASALAAALIAGGVAAHWGWRSLQDRLAEQAGAHGVLYEVIVDREEARDPFAIEQLWSYMHGICRDRNWLSWFEPLPFIAFEVHSLHRSDQGRNEICFYFWVPREFEEMLVRRIRATYPHAQIKPASPDYIPVPSDDPDQRIFAGAELELKYHHALPLRTYQEFTKSDPLNAIASAMAELEDREEMVLQVLMRPVGDYSWRKQSLRVLKEYERTGRRPRPVNPGLYAFVALLRPVALLGDLIGAAVKHLVYPGRMDKPPEVREENRSGIVEKREQQSMGMKTIEQHGFAIRIRALVATPYGSERAMGRLRALVAAFNELNADNVLVARYPRREQMDAFARQVARRHFPNDYRRNVVSPMELAAFCHLPGPNNLVPGIKRISARELARPAAVRSVDYFARDKNGNLIGLDIESRMRHMFVIGMTGVGKSTMLERMVINDIHAGRGVILIDPHGDLARSVIEKIDSSRPDVYVFRPYDIEYPVGLNILEVESLDPAQRELEKQLVVDSFITTLKRVFPPGSIGPSSEDIFRMAASALVDQPDGASFLEVLLMLTSHSYREKAIKFIEIPQVKHYWTVNFPAIEANRNTQALLAPPLNKTRRFVADRMVSRIICQLESTLNIKSIMDSGGVLICDLSQGLTGEENSVLLGSMILAKIQIAAMMRANIPYEQRTPCFVYVDEFQNFVGGSESSARSFEKMLSEARKYRISLTMANQYLGQLTPALQAAIFGNCGSIVAFRVGPFDADVLEKYFAVGEHRFTAEDLKLLEKYQVAARLMVDGVTGPPVTAWTLPPVEPHPNANPDLIIERSRSVIGVDRRKVEESIMQRMQEYDKAMPAIS